MLTDPPQETSCVLLRHSLDSPLRASTPGRLPQTGSEPKLTRGPSQRRGQAPCWCPVAGARAQRRSGHAYTHARRRVGGRNPPPPKTTSLRKAAWCCLRNPPAPGAGRHPQPLGCRGRWPQGGREYEAAAPPRLSRRVEGVRVPVGLGALFLESLEKGLRPDGLRHSLRDCEKRGRWGVGAEQF